MDNLIGKVAVVTGASRGIGRATAIALAKNGASVLVNYRENEEAAEETLKSIKEIGAYGIIFKADVSDFKESEKLIKQAVDKFGKIDILVNNAGISNVGLFIDMNETDWNKMIDINLKGTINCSHNAIKYMIPKKSGSIINISSMWGDIGASCEVIYSSTKGAINLFTKSLAKELAPSNIRINAVAPGVIDTDMNKWLSEDEKHELEEEIPVGKFGTVNDIANTVLFLSKNSSKYITGQIIRVDGGIS
ncbi:SDR family oxidoreductase [Clostridium fermenticellae]|uniref:SDR family oxidoreductase n=1 Tax=Clostridium fermenticellae TaxID=2068654 RepID=A0A386H338_9CLOT|nr:SDR family oxidoreductase [Clostridium fermenticellae]AYD39895.1 SDR family oxidoreductase [Clostridium fermenticellae]